MALQQKNDLKKQIKDLFNKHSVEGLNNYDFDKLTNMLSTKVNNQAYTDMKQFDKGATKTRINTVLTSQLDGDVIKRMKDLNFISYDLSNPVVLENYTKFIETTKIEFSEGVELFHDYINDDVFKSILEKFGDATANKYKLLKAKLGNRPSEMNKLMKNRKETCDNPSGIKRKDNELDPSGVKRRGMKLRPTTNVVVVEDENINENKNNELLNVIKKLKKQINKTDNDKIKTTFQDDLIEIKQAIVENNNDKKNKILKEDWDIKIEDQMQRLMESEEIIFDTNINRSKTKKRAFTESNNKSNPMNHGLEDDITEIAIEKAYSQFNYGSDTKPHVQNKFDENFNNSDLELFNDVINNNNTTKQNINKLNKNKNISNHINNIGDGINQDLLLWEDIIESNSNDGFNPHERNNKNMDVPLIDDIDYSDDNNNDSDIINLLNIGSNFLDI